MCCIQPCVISPQDSPRKCGSHFTAKRVKCKKCALLSCNVTIILRLQLQYLLHHFSLLFYVTDYKWKRKNNWFMKKWQTVSYNLSHIIVKKSMANVMIIEKHVPYFVRPWGFIISHSKKLKFHYPVPSKGPHCCEAIIQRPKHKLLKDQMCCISLHFIYLFIFC